jgi:DNA-3-methyladenine glycosylase II
MAPPYIEPRTIATEDDLDAGLAALVRLEPRFAGLLSWLGRPPLRRMPDTLESLLGLVFHQQVSLASGAAIEVRFRARFGGADPACLASATEADLAGCGLSRPKIRAVKAIAEAVSMGALDLAALHGLGDAEARAELQKVHGIGPWTAELWLLSALGRPDAFPAADLALQSAAAGVFGLATRPAGPELMKIAEPWRPWRAVAARLLWSHYAQVKASR